MKTSSSKSTTFMIIIVVAIAVIGYFYYQGKADAPVGNLEVSNSSDIGFAEVRLLEQIRTVAIDTTFFEDPIFQSLVDYSVEIPTQPVGRDNPFAPI